MKLWLVPTTRYFAFLNRRFAFELPYLILADLSYFFPYFIVFVQMFAKALPMSSVVGYNAKVV